MGAHFGSLLREIRISVSAKNEVLLAWEFNFQKFPFLCEFHVFREHLENSSFTCMRAQF